MTSSNTLNDMQWVLEFIAHIVCGIDEYTEHPACTLQAHGGGLESFISRGKDIFGHVY